MDKDRLILEFADKEMGEILITKPTTEILYRNRAIGFTDEEWAHYVARGLKDLVVEEDTEWEITDKEAGRRLRVHSDRYAQDGEEYILHHVYDVSDDYNLIRELSAYSKERQQMVNFQNEMLAHISGSLTDCLPIIMRFLDVEECILCVDRKNCVDSYQTVKGSDGISFRREEYHGQFDAPRESHVITDDDKDYLCYMNETTRNGQRFALYMPGDIDDEWDTFPMHFNVIRLFVENMLLEEEIVYESEHDHLTKIYNKGKYLSMLEDFFPKCERIAVFNMDVNYLKRLNDSMGHEAGDKLLQKAARSLMAVERDNVAAYRMGGDEFLLVAWDVSMQEAEELLRKWHEALDTLNKEDDGIECVIACGLSYGGPGHDLEQVLKLADERMYADKVAIKRKRGDDPDAR